MYSIFKIIVLSDLKFVVISLFIITFFTVRAVKDKDTDESQLNNTYSVNSSINRQKGISSNDVKFISGEFAEANRKNDSPGISVNNSKPIGKDTTHVEEIDSINLQYEEIPTDVLYYSLFQFTSISLYQTAY